jgi:hypothetical protein
MAGVLAVLASGATADSTGPIPGYLDQAPWFEDVKSPPLAESDWFAVTWGMHVTYAFTNYAGLLFDLAYDGAETSVLNVSPAGPHVGNTYELFGSECGWTVAFPVSVWHPNAVNSGATVNSSSLVPAFFLSGHAKATTTGNNSDIDITASVWQILHIVQSGTYQVAASDWLYLTMGGVNFESQPMMGTWFHPTSTMQMFIPASAFLATNAWIDNAGGYGIEHIPEPLSALLLMAGAGALVRGRRMRAA